MKPGRFEYDYLGDGVHHFWTDFRDTDTYQAALDWCEERWGREHTGTIWWSLSMDIINCRGDDRALEFRLRWC